MQKEIDAVNMEILTKITPTQKDRAKIEALAKQLEQQVAAACKAHGVKATVRVEGSVAKDTWLREEPDIDIFMRLPTSIPRRDLGEISLKIARESTQGARQIERFAEHPYLEAFIDSVRVNIVPCYDAKPGEWLSATDRTPFHTDYVKKRLNERLRGEVRLLKKFLQGIKAYGAEIKTGGFSGYLCELLILHHESFTQTLHAFTKFTPRTTVDIEHYYKGREKEPRLLFPEPLVIVDPVDKGRNVASAVQPQKLYTFVAAGRAYLKKPATSFFYPPKTETLTANALKTKLENHGSDIIFLPLDKIDAVPDVLWGQLYRTQRALRKQIELSDFKVLRDAAWSDEKNLNTFVFEVEQRRLPSVKKHLGPPLEREKECENFLSKYSSNEAVVSGPYIEDGRWIVELKRKYTDIAALLKEKLTDGGRDAGVAELIAQAFREKLEILVNAEVIEVYRGNRAFAEFLTSFLSGKPFWLANTIT
ncbi:MAG: CCA tRNA nucleotidyltransferase [Candidatus Bathyarchaeota archaeon]|nr:CCA tRNA nucleotidyltransferase [Candidatus Bathyarchaeota archaeon]